MRKWYLSIIILIIITFFGYQYIYQEHRDIEKETASFTITTSKINGEFIKNVNQAKTKYLNKTVELTGAISELNDSDLTIDELVFCSFNIPFDNTSLKTQAQIKIKGRVIGYDDLLEQVKIDQCIIID